MSSLGAFYSGRTVLVTGAAQGLGRHMALALGRLGARLVITDLHAGKLEDLAQELKAMGREVVHATADVTDMAQMQALKERVPKDWGMHVVIANAGVGGLNPAHHFSVEMDRKTMSINYFGVVNTLALFLDEMKAQRFGTLVGISSLASIRGLPNACSYSASKAAQNNLLESWRLDLAPYGVRVCCVRPGFIKTPMTDHGEFPLPFLVAPERAADLILKAAADGKKVFSFPWPMALLSFLNKWLPVWLYDLILPLTTPHSDQKRPKIF